MTTFDLIKRSDVLLAPPKYSLRSHTMNSHGRVFNIGMANGIHDIPRDAISVKMGIGILAWPVSASKKSCNI